MWVAGFGRDWCKIASKEATLVIGKEVTLVRNTLMADILAIIALEPDHRRYQAILKGYSSKVGVAVTNVVKQEGPP